MADISITKYKTKVTKPTASPSNPGYPTSDPIDPVNPPASGAGGGGVNTFLQLTDTPASYTGQAGLFPRVNSGETGLEFASAIGGTIASGQVAFGTGVNTVGGDSGLTWDNVNKILEITSTTAAQVRLLRSFLSGVSTMFTITNTDNTNLNTEPSIAIQHRDNSTNNVQGARIGSEITARGSNVVTASLKFYTNQNSTLPTLRWSILSNGEFQSNGSNNISSSSNGNINIIPNGTGRVGINTSSPNAKFEVALGAIGEYMRVGGDDASNARALRFSSSNDGAVGNLHNINASSGVGILTFSTASTERIRIISTGLVGIGGITPTNTLDVNGTARIRTLSNATGDFVTTSATGVLQKRTAAEVVSDLGVGSKWTDGTTFIYRNGKVVIGGSSSVDSQLYINQQSGIGSALIINQIPRSLLLRNTIIIQDSDGKTPFNLENNGISTWKFFDGTNNKGAWKVDYGTSSDVVTFKTSWDQLFSTDVTGFNFNPSNTSASVSSWSMFIRGTTRFVMSATGKTAWNNGTSFASTATHQIRGVGDAIIANFVNSAGTLAPIQILDNGNCNMYDGGGMQFGTINGYKLGTATSQKLAFWNATPIVQPSGDILTALANLGLVASPTITQVDQFAVKTTASADQTLPSGTLTILDYDSTLLNNSTATYTVGTDGRITINTTGIYTITAGVVIEADAVTALESAFLGIFRNGDLVAISSINTTIAAGAQSGLSTSTILSLTATDVIDCRALVNSVGGIAPGLARRLGTLLGASATQVNSLSITKNSM